MIHVFLRETYSAHSAWIVTVALAAFAIIFIYGALCLAKYLDDDLANLDDT